MAETTKDKIINTTYNLMLEMEDINSITVRMIATKADVNVAMVNYYFQSKENLFNEVINTIMITSKQIFETLDDDSVPPRERLFNFVINYQKHMLKHKKFISYLFVTKQVFPTQMSFINFLRSQGILKIQSCIKELLQKQRSGGANVNTTTNTDTTSKNTHTSTITTTNHTHMDIETRSKFIFDHLMSVMVFPVIYNASVNNAVQEMKTTLISYNQYEESLTYFFDTYFPEM